ncbi:glycine zipper 2TM domain-containing protein [Phenylobacterium sp.]|uniref:glycine zipper 2TM domain-containing protein n=1 Tax=Phenylobacterium sp. TaxID=1871053 RepID=UPI002DF3F7CB|nr:glycine zipper domain-containing protein [Phenylobacterium sp.]
MNRSSFARLATRGVAALAAGALALGAVSAAQAQPYGQYGYAPAPGYNNYDPCQRDASGRGIVGALVGGGIGATVGSQVSANHHRSDGSLVGGVLGALVGASVGHNSAACRPGAYAPPPPPPQAAYNSYGGYGYGPPPPPVYEGRYEEGPGFAFGRRGERLRIADGRIGADGCTLAESPIYLPDGRVQKRFVRVCMDSDGRYQVVD